jgi:hypothetical protein
MPTKDIYLFDSSNAPLHVKGIRVELFDAPTGTLLDAQLSDDLNPGSKPSNEWGVELTFTACANPLDVYFSDPKYKYPGNTVLSLNGKIQGRVDVDLLCLPTGPGGQSGPPPSGAPVDVEDWIENGNWSDEEKRAVRTLASNFARLIVPKMSLLGSLPALNSVAVNWSGALQKVGLEANVLLARANVQRFNTMS